MSYSPYPMLRIARQNTALQGFLGECVLKPTGARRISTSHSFRASNRTRNGTVSGKSDISASSQASSSSSRPSTSSASKIISSSPLTNSKQSAAGRAYSASVRAKPVNFPSSAEPPKGSQTKEGKKKGDDSVRSEGRPDNSLEGGAQKMFRKEAIDPDISSTKNPNIDKIEAGTKIEKGQKGDPTDKTNDPVGADDQIKLAEGVIISASGNQPRQDQSRKLFPPSGSSTNEQESSSTQNSQNEGDGDGGGPPAVTEKISPESNDTPPRQLFRYPFNTHAFIKRLQEAEFIPANRIDTKAGSSPNQSSTALSANKRHDPAEAIMESLHLLLVTRGQEVVDSHMNKTEAENQAYLFTAALAELRTELQVRARNDAAALRSMVTLLQREVDSLNQRMREDVASMKHDIQVDMNNRKSEAKEEQNTLDQEIQDLNNRFTISISDLKTEIEQSIKWDATRRALTIFFGCIVILIATLAAADYLTRDEVEVHSRNGKNQAGKEQDDIKLKTPEELGLIARDDEHGNRFV